MAECEEIDVIVHGAAGEQAIVGLIRTWEQTDDLSAVDGITWRNGHEIVVNRSRTRSRIWMNIDPAGNWWTGAAIPCLGSTMQRACSSVAAVR